MLRDVFVLSVLLFVSTSSLSAGEYNPVLDIGDKAPDWEKLPGVDSKELALADLKKVDVVVLVFTCNSCPYAIDYEERIIEFVKEHCGKDSGVRLVAVNVNKVEEDLPAAMKQRAEEQKFNFPYLFDETQKIAKDYGAGATPEFFVLNRERKIVYMGAMDDSPDAKKVKRRWVEEAVAAALKGKLPEVKETVPIGCRIRFERRRRTRSRE